MASWDWPVPMQPSTAGFPRCEVDDLHKAGLSIFLPWYLVRGDQVDVQSILRQARTGSVPNHLRGWVNKTTAGKDKGHDFKFSAIRWLYRCYALVLSKRYAVPSMGNRNRLDLALAPLLKRDVEAFRKLRADAIRVGSLTQ